VSIVISSALIRLTGGTPVRQETRKKRKKKRKREKKNKNMADSKRSITARRSRTPKAREGGAFARAAQSLAGMIYH